MMYRGLDENRRRRKQRVIAGFIGAAALAEIVSSLLANTLAMRSLRVILLFVSAAAIAGLLVYIFAAKKAA